MINKRKRVIYYLAAFGGITLFILLMSFPLLMMAIEREHQELDFGDYPLIALPLAVVVVFIMIYLIVYSADYDCEK